MGDSVIQSTVMVEFEDGLRAEVLRLPGGAIMVTLLSSGSTPISSWGAVGPGVVYNEVQSKRPT